MLFQNHTLGRFMKNHSIQHKFTCMLRSWIIGRHNHDCRIISALSRVGCYPIGHIRNADS